ncbi:MAG: PEP/pyruvate-binding domain-containing protein [Candidatus Nanoarchaeia archaeon]|jgi:phosphoenolpyruvate synthase/pyruvate phosphate dikinase|nr:PEP/pyruvate-binding domain-containing protein [Candidatus Nanoarchaeia archaeon]|tara:strand:+ start:69181 stop:70986 length:1806 start_codon:yes stop_codon:yes gene_type:complete
MKIIWFNKIKKDNIDLVGKKSIDLSELYDKGLPTPPGFVLTTESFKDFLDFSGIRTTILDLMNNLNFENNEKLTQVIEKIQDLIIRAPFPDYINKEILEEYSNLNVDPETFSYTAALSMIKSGRELPFVVLRPSTINGLDPETFLDIKGNTNLLEAIKRCWSSHYNKELVHYRAKNNIPHDSLVAIIIQKQIQPDKSGIILINNDITIKSNYGISETILSNLVQPDIHVVDKNNFLVKETSIGSKEFMIYFDENIKKNSKRNLSFKSGEQTLNDLEINKLVDLSIKIKDSYGPKQIEFAIKSGSAYILNLKPIQEELIQKTEIENPNLETITKIGVDLEETNDSDKATIDADSVFLKLENIIKKRQVNPMSLVQENDYNYINFLITEIEKVTRSFRNKNILIRTSDIINEDEKNSLIGWRGIRRALDESVILRAEFNAIKKLNDLGYEKINIVLPFITTINELRQVKDLMKEVGISNDIGIMLDTPSNCEIIDNFCKEGIKFVVFGTDNLTQLMLGVDKFNDRTAKLFNEKHPSLLRTIQKVISVCRQFNIETNLIGRISSDPEMIDFLVSVGLNSIIVNLEELGRVKGIISRTEKRLVVE